MNDPMKPCSQHQKAIAWLVIDALDVARAGVVRKHLEACPACREYWADLRAIGREHQHAAENFPETPVGEAFHRRLEQRLEADDSRPGLLQALDTFRRAFDSIDLRFASAAAAVLAAALVLWWTTRQGPSPRPTEFTVTAPLLPRTESIALPPPTLSSYRVAPNRSPDALDELVARQAVGSSSAGAAATIYAFRRSELEP